MRDNAQRGGRRRRAARITGAALAVLLAQGASGDVLSSKSRKSLFASQLDVLDTRAASQYGKSVRLQPPTVNTPTKWDTPGWRGRYSGPYLAVARAAAGRHGIPEGLFLRLVQQESAWNSGAVSPKGAIGLAQLMPATARHLGVDPHDPHQNLEGGARYLAQQYRDFRSWRLALAAYNAGPEAVRRYGGVPPYRETQGYVRAILDN